MSYTQNRELSWLRFNERVLEEAENENVPLLERLKFIEIFSSNLDEFFMVRVGSLRNIMETDPNHIDYKSNMNSEEQLNAIYDKAKELYNKRNRIYRDLKISLKQNGLDFVTAKDLNDEDLTIVKKKFRMDILPLLSAQIIDFNHPFPHLENKGSYIIVELKENHLGLIPVNGFVNQYFRINDKMLITYERMIYDFASFVYKGFKIINKNIISVTRNADIDYDEIDNEEFDFRSVMKALLKKRNRLSVVRLECYKDLVDSFKNILYTKLNIDDNVVFTIKTPSKFQFVYNLMSENKDKTLLYPLLTQRSNSFIDYNKTMFENVNQHDILSFYPYESMDPFLKLVKEACLNKTVTQIYITIYRLSNKSRLVDYLCSASEAGIEVNVLIELRARFDEKNNINFSEKLEESGCKIMYGFDEFKVHSKLCLIVKSNGNKVSYITQIGTGNYNEKTVGIYTDYSLMTSDSEIGSDAHLFFKNMLLGNLKDEYTNLLVSPNGLKSKILAMIREEALKPNGYIFIKCNSITDIDIINALKDASTCDTKIDLIVRGICCLIPGLEETANITVRSIVGRFLEHSRIYLFGNTDPSIYIGSADMMTRNTSRRVEVAVKVKDKNVKAEIMNHIKAMLKDNTNARLLSNTGEYQKINGSEAFDCQKEFQKPIKIVKKPVELNYKDKLISLLKNDNQVVEPNVKLELGLTKAIFDFKCNNKVIKIFNNITTLKRTNEKYYFYNEMLGNKGLELILLLPDKSESLYTFLDNCKITYFQKNLTNEIINTIKEVK